MKIVNSGPLYSLQEVADTLNIQPNDIEMWATQGFVPAYNFSEEGEWGFYQADIYRHVHSMLIENN
jgi:hypothetical protein